MIKSVLESIVMNCDERADGKALSSRKHYGPHHFQSWWHKKLHLGLPMIWPFLDINPLCTQGFFLLVLYNQPGMVHCKYQGVIG